MAGSYCCHDHIVLLVDSKDFEDPPSWLKDNFHVIEGGEHTGGSSRNKLIIFSDGTYLELFNFIKNPVEFTDWAEKSPGLIDFALTTLRPFNATTNFDQVSKNLELRGGDAGLGVKYLPPKAGGRKRKDGKDVKWEVTRPEYRDAESTPSAEMFPSKRIDVPFFCHDVTPRVVRVPWDEEEIVQHQSGASGIAAVEVLVPPEQLTAYSTLYSSITGSSPEQLKDKSKKGVSFDLAIPTSQARGPVIKVRVPTSDEDRTWLKERGIGIREIQLSVKGRKGHGEQQLAGDGTGSTVSLVW